MKPVRVIAFVLGLVLAQPAFSQSEFKPAKFRDSDRIHEKISFPKKGGDLNLIIPCKLFLPMSGRIEVVYCHKPERVDYGWLFQRAIIRALNGIKMDRAMVDGKAKKVWVFFMVAFIREGEQETIEVHLNQASEYDRYGVEYIGPQRIVPLDRIINLKKCNADTNVWIETMVEADGNPSATKIIGGSATQRCRESFLEQYKRTSYIPAHVRGRPVRALYHQSVGGLVGR